MLKDARISLKKLEDARISLKMLEYACVFRKDAGE